ncbi:hypothetical protein, partial [Rubripirellula reticaptiva]|uniref:hypothetical protein n=1 Tax=Rubripirellula reticaptiva TaxID=2528013 RepID=UPI001C962F12
AAGPFIAWHLRAGNTPLNNERLDFSDDNAILGPKRNQRAIALGGGASELSVFPETFFVMTTKSLVDY